MRSRSRSPWLALALVLACAACGGNDPTGASNAPASHTVSQGGVRHAPGLNTPQQSCTSCHGADLRGGADAPSCYSCHGKKWS